MGPRAANTYVLKHSPDVSPVGVRFSLDDLRGHPVGCPLHRLEPTSPAADGLQRKGGNRAMHETSYKTSRIQRREGTITQLTALGLTYAQHVHVSIRLWTNSCKQMLAGAYELISS